MNSMSNDIFIFSFVRMNPPTPGHLELIKSMIDKAFELGSTKVYVLLSNTVDEKNPLACNNATMQITPIPNVTYKSNILNNMIVKYKQHLIENEPDQTNKYKINNLEIKVICTSGNPFGFISKTINDDFIENGVNKVKLYGIVGSDRADFLNRIKNNFKDKSYISSVDGRVLGREGMEDLLSRDINEENVNDINPSAFSASFVRGLVKKEKLGVFQKVYSKYLVPNQIQQLYDSIGLGLQMNQPTETVKKTKRIEVEAPPSKSARTSTRTTRSSMKAGGRKRGLSRRRKITRKNKRKTYKRY